MALWICRRRDYMPKMSLFGYELSLNKNNQQNTQEVVDKARIRKGIEILKEYKKGKENLEQQILENEEWYKLQHWDYIRKKRKGEEPEPVTGYLFNTIANKHADIMDNYPEASLLPRVKDDEEESEMLTDIVPIVVERNDYKLTYDDSAWYFLKHGMSAEGVFWNFDLENGLGDIDIQSIDILNIYWQPGIKKLQKSANLFITTFVDNDLLKEQYKDILPPEFVGSKIIDIKQYKTVDTVDITNKSVVVDWYYRKIVNGKPVLHLTKFVDEYKLGSTEDEPGEYPDGLYWHGQYPVVIDVLFPEEGTPTGFGYIHVVKNPQMYVDKLDQIISRNALVSGKQRTLYNTSGKIDVNALKDLSIDFVPCEGKITDEDIYPLQANPLHPFIVKHRENKIAELKEISGANDFSRGESGGGITAASAIMALQEAGNKLSRDMIQRKYSCYAQKVYMVIELIRQFYTEDRQFRIVGDNGQAKYDTYNNAGLQDKLIPPMFPGEEPKYRRVVLDIKVKPEKQSPFSRIAHNELAKELFGAGFFNPQVSDQAIVALEMMSFEGKDKIIQKVQENGTLMQQMQQIMQQLQQMQQENMKLRAIVQKMTGQDMGAADTIMQQEAEQRKVAESIYGRGNLQAG